MNITFPSIEVRESFDVVFPADVDGERVHCKVSIEALQDFFGAGGNGLPTFQANRGEFERIAEQKIRTGQFGNNGSILITTADFR